jgi:hypothetical protein
MTVAMCYVIFFFPLLSGLSADPSITSGWDHCKTVKINEKQTTPPDVASCTFLLIPAVIHIEGLLLVCETIIQQFHRLEDNNLFLTALHYEVHEIGSLLY